MLGGNFEEYFKQKVIKNCGVNIYDSSSNLLLSASNILSFNMERENHCVPDELPYDDVTIEINTWKTLSQSIKDYLQTRNNSVLIKFVVENVETTTGIRLYINKCKVDYYGVNATLTLNNIFTTPIYTSSTSPFQFVKLTASNAIVYPYKNSTAETIQSYYMSAGRAIKTGGFTGYTNVSITDYNINTSIDFENVMGNLSTYDDEEDKSNIVAVGWVYEEGDYIDEYQPAPSVYIAEVLTSEQLVITSAQSKMNGGNWTDCNCSMRATSFVVSNQLNTSYSWRVKCYQPKVNYGDNDKVVMCHFLFDTDTAKLSAVQTTLRDYYSKKYYEFDCRLDPRLEPLDVVYIDTIGAIKVEHVSLDFRGGFMGRIKGRKVGNVFPTLQKVIIDMEYDTDYFKLTNSNNVAVIAQVHTSDGNTTDIEIPANSYVAVEVQDYPYVEGDWNRVRLHTLTTNTYITTYAKDQPYWTAQEETIVYLAIKEPVIEVDTNYPNWSIKIENKNQFEVRLEISYSSGTFERNIGAGETIILTDDNASELDESFLAYRIGDLLHRVDCAFMATNEGGYDQYTAWLVILEAQTNG